MIKILLDTNMFIYLEDHCVTNAKVLELTKRLYDSDEYKIVIHPMTKKEIEGIKDEKNKLIFRSKIEVYKEINNPPKPNPEFHELVGCKNSHDEIDNCLLFAIKRNCASYLITNDKKIKKKSFKLNIEEKVLTIDEALDKFKIDEEEKIIKPAFVEEKYLHELDIEDSFFDSLRFDYNGFNNWFEKKQSKGEKAYVTFNDGNITSFLMLKLEDEHEKYEEFQKPFLPAKRLKISTMKVVETGKRIGETFIKIIVRKAISSNVDEIYVTVFKKHAHLIDMLNEYGFQYYGQKKTLNSIGESLLENIYVKKIKKLDNYYPFLDINDRRTFIVPIKDKYHRLLFQESERIVQLTLDDMCGTNTASNSLRKAYLCHSNIKQIIPGSIILFYSSEREKAITSLGVVDAVFDKFDNFDEMYNLVKRRTAYSEDELKAEFRTDTLVILFKHYYSFDNYVSFDYLIKNNIVNGSIQTAMRIEKADLIKILDECKLDKKRYLIL